MNILALSPHTDDAELGAGGTLARFVEEGHAVAVAALSTGNSETGSNRAEFEAAMDALGVGTYELYSYETREFSAARQHILDRLVMLRARFVPDLVLVPCTAERHQDHGVVTAEAVRAFRDCCMLGYGSLRSHTLPITWLYFVRLEERHLERKLAAVACYRSQADKVYTDATGIRALAQVHGIRVGAEYAEAFEVLKWVV